METLRNPTEILKILREKSQNKSYRFHRLYRNLYNPEFYYLAYNNICTGQGNMTEGVDGQTIDGMSAERIDRIIATLKDYLKHQGSHILPDLITNLQAIRERKFLWSVDVVELNKQIAELTSQNQLLATLRESGCVDPDIFISKSNKLTEQLRAAKQAKSRILNQDGDDTIPCTQELITILKRGPETLHDFDGELFGQLIDKVIIESNTSLRFRLKNELELRENIERTVR